MIDKFKVYILVGVGSKIVEAHIVTQDYVPTISGGYLLELTQIGSNYTELEQFMNNFHLYTYNVGNGSIVGPTGPIDNRIIPMDQIDIGIEGSLDQLHTVLEA